MRNALVIATVAFAIGALWTAVYVTDTAQPAHRCDHAASSMAVALGLDGKIVTTQAPHETGCTP